MASYKIEDAHVKQLNKLLEESGLECVRSLSLSSLEESIGELEEQGPVEEEEIVPEEETRVEESLHPQEESKEEEERAFPTPSLRRVIPDKIREIEEQFRIHVLPEEFKTNIDPEAIPKITKTPQQKYIDILADLVGCSEYKSSLAEFWFLDTLANLLRRAQEDHMDRRTQVVLIRWFCEFMKEMQHFDAASRQRMLERLQDNMMTAVRYIGKEEQIPSPSQVGITYKPIEGRILVATKMIQTSKSEQLRQGVKFENTAYECSLADLTRILHYTFDLISTDYQYDLIRSIFTTSPEYIMIEAPYQIQVPKSMYTKGKPKKEKPTTAKGKKQVPLSSELLENDNYVALMELKERDEREQEERKERDREEWNKRSHILPLNMAATEEFFNQYWPPSIPDLEPEPEPEPEPEIKKKGKGKK